ncbi:unnamed protein product [Pseudo-nitzschia multistriata]|uniref:FAD-binding FR-type domain-containing protein n=1 Tax=Pseudo-nitzschia multistriata TaxID=183589 RepID=A0A448ZQK5_9STRA|nr:unnamed protein product [Pseudo-nitzschia multistriata]
MQTFYSLLLFSKPRPVVVLFLAASVVVDSFAPATIRSGVLQHHRTKNASAKTERGTLLFAESPQYQKQEGILRRSECVGKGSYLLYIDCVDDDTNGYKPGHVLALEIQPPAVDGCDDVEVSETMTMNEKTRKDMEANEGWMRGPYTVSRGYGTSSEINGKAKNDGFQVLVKEVGYKSHVFSTCPEGTPVRYGGKFKVPIAEGILEAAETNDSEDRGATKRVIMVSTGVGVGPCLGASEILVNMLTSSDAKESTIHSINLVTSFRTREEIAMASDLDKLQQQQQGRNPEFHWESIITGETGRLSASGPECLLDQYVSPAISTGSAIRNTHYHIIGNGQLVNEWTAGLEQAGVPPSRVTTEAYFNHKGEADPVAVNAICQAILRLDRDAESKEVETAVEQAARDA